MLQFAIIWILLKSLKQNPKAGKNIIDSSYIALLITKWQNKIPQESSILFQDKLKQIPEDKTSILTTIQLKNPVVGLIFGFFSWVSWCRSIL